MKKTLKSIQEQFGVTPKYKLQEQMGTPITPKQFVNDLKQTLWGRGAGSKEGGQPQQYTMLMNTENEIYVYVGKYKQTGPDYIVQI